jgi:hypothetical protein
MQVFMYRFDEMLNLDYLWSMSQKDGENTSL